MRSLIQVFWFVLILSITILAFAGEDERVDKLHYANKILGQAYQFANRIEEVAEFRIDEGIFVTTSVREKLRLLSMIALSQASSGDLETARGTFNTILLIIQSIRDEKTKAWTLRELTEAQATAGDIPGALRTVALIQREGERIYPLIKIASAQFMTGDQVNARVSLKKAFQFTRKDQALTGLVLYHIGVAQARIGDVQGAIESAKAVDDLYRMNLLAEIAAAYIRGGDQKGASEIVTRIKENKGKGFILIKIALAQVENDPSAAVKTLQKALKLIKNSEEPEFIIGDFAVAYAIAGRPEEAFRIAHNIRNENTKANTLREVLQVLKEKEGSKQVAPYVKQAIQMAREIKDSHTKGYALQEISKLQLVFGDKAGALGTASLFVSEIEDFRLMDLLYVAEIQKEAGDREAAKRSIQRAIRSMEKSGRFYELSSIVRTQIKLGDLVGATELVKSREELDPWVLIDVASAQARAGEMDAAFQTIAPLEESAWRVEALARFAQEQADTGSGPAIELSLLQAFLLAQVKSEGLRKTSVEIVFSNQGTCGYILEHRAKKLVQEENVKSALALAESLTFPYLKARTLIGVAEGILDGMGMPTRRLRDLFDPPVH